MTTRWLRQRRANEKCPTTTSQRTSRAGMLSDPTATKPIAGATSTERADLQSRSLLWGSSGHGREQPVKMQQTCSGEIRGALQNQFKAKPL
jgi:hypothetical protein